MVKILVWNISFCGCESWIYPMRLMEYPMSLRCGATDGLRIIESTESHMKLLEKVGERRTLMKGM